MLIDYSATECVNPINGAPINPLGRKKFNKLAPLIAFKGRINFNTTRTTHMKIMTVSRVQEVSLVTSVHLRVIIKVQL